MLAELEIAGRSGAQFLALPARPPVLAFTSQRTRGGLCKKGRSVQPRPAIRKYLSPRPSGLTDNTCRRPYSAKAASFPVSGDNGDLDVETIEPEDARGAISVGLKLHDAGKFEEALKIFKKALDLPGTGLKRYRDKPNLISDGEKQACMYNIACCHSKLGNTRDGLVAVAICLESGYQDFQQLETDPDMEELRKDKRFAGLLSRFRPDKSAGGFFGDLLKGFRS